MKYTEQEEKELNKQLKKWQNKARKLILDDYYDTAANCMNELNHSILRQVTNAETHRDVNTHLWNSGAIEKTLDLIEEKIKKAKKEERQNNGNLRN